MLELVVPGYRGSGRRHPRCRSAARSRGSSSTWAPSAACARPRSSYRHYLDRFEAYLARIGVTGLEELSPALLSAFTAERAGAGLAKTTVRGSCGVLRVFLRYAHREGHHQQAT